jgi:hypothetical protein
VSATVFAFPAVRHTPVKRSGNRATTTIPMPPKASPCRFTAEARNALNGLSYALPHWRVDFVAQDDGGEWATLTEILGIDAPFLLHGANDPAFIVCAESDGGLLVRDKDFVALETFATPYTLVTALRRLL